MRGSRAFSIEQLEHRRLLATLTVTNDADVGVGSLRHAIAIANNTSGDDRIEFSSNLPDTIQIVQGAMRITDDLEIVGPGADRLTLSAGGLSPIFELYDGNGTADFSVTISGLELTGGYSSDTGGAIFSYRESLTLREVSITGSSAYLSGGGVGSVGGSLTIERSTISGNSAEEGGGVMAFVDIGYTLEISQSTLSGNTADAGGGISAAVHPYSTTASIRHSTIVENEAYYSGGIYASRFNLALPRGSVELDHSIVATNTGTFAPDVNDNVVPTNSIIGNNYYTQLEFSLPCPHDPYPCGQDDNGNYIGHPNFPIDPLLGPLSDNGGPTPTHAPLDGSPAIDTGNVTMAPATSDQRGMRMPIDGRNDGVASAEFDRGAVEFVPSVPLVVTSAGDAFDGVFFDGRLTLREAAAISNVLPDSQTITFDTSFIGSTINLQATLDVTDSTIINGLGADRLTLNGNGADRVLYIYDANPNVHRDVTITDLSITGGVATGNFAGGGGIFSRENLDLSRSTLHGNSAMFGGGLSHFGGDLVVRDSSFYANSASVHGGGVQMSMFTGQTALLENSTVSDNTAAETGGGVSAFDGGGTINILFTTITGNTTTGGGIGGGGIGVLQGTVGLRNSIVSGNSDGSGQAPDATTGLAATYSLISDNTGSGIGAGQPTFQMNIVGTAAAPIDPLLGPLQDNGGTTPTHALLPGSPAIDRGSNLILFPPAHDQRGAPFTRRSGTFGDMGAIEFIDGLSMVVTTQQDELDPFHDAADLSLREALAVAAHVHSATVSFDTAGVFATPQTIALTLGELTIDNDVTLYGPGSELVTIDAQQNSRVFTVETSATAEVSGVTITGGRVGGKGGGIRNFGQLVVRDTVIANNEAYSQGFAVGKGGGVHNQGMLEVHDSTISGNTGSSRGGGIDSEHELFMFNSVVANNSSNHGGGLGLSNFAYLQNSAILGNSSIDGGGVYLPEGELFVQSSSISNNSSSFGGGFHIRGGNFTQATILDSTIAGNQATEGGGLFNHNTEVLVLNSTLSGNIAERGGAIAAFDAIMDIQHSTVTSNTATAETGGIHSDGTGTALISNSIVAENVNSTSPNLGGSATLMYSLIGDNSGTALTEAPVGSPDANGNLIGGPIGGTIDPLLGPLADNGGVTLTHELLMGSPAINAGDPAAMPGVGDVPDFDQRGIDFTRVADGRIDMGAFEVHAEVVDGDFNHDEVYDCDDIDALIAEIAAGTHNLAFDLSGDGNVDLVDRDLWLAEAGAANLPSGNPFLPGDANLDGLVDVADFAIWNANKFTNVAAWCQADFTADGVVDGFDLLLWNENRTQTVENAYPIQRQSTQLAGPSNDHAQPDDAGLPEPSAIATTLDRPIHSRHVDAVLATFADSRRHRTNEPLPQLARWQPDDWFGRELSDVLR